MKKHLRKAKTYSWSDGTCKYCNLKPNYSQSLPLVVESVEDEEAPGAAVTADDSAVAAVVDWVALTQSLQDLEHIARMVFLSKKVEVQKP